LRKRTFGKKKYDKQIGNSVSLPKNTISKPFH